MIQIPKPQLVDPTSQGRATPLTRAWHIDGSSFGWSISLTIDQSQNIN